MATLSTRSKLVACVCVAGALAAPAASQAAEPSSTAGASASVSAAAQLEAGAVLDSRRAARIVRRSSSRARSFVARSLRRLERAYSITIDATGSAGAGAAGSEQAASAAAQFSAAATSQSAALGTLVDRASGDLERTATAALDRIAAMQSSVALSLDGSAQANGQGGSSDVGVSVGIGSTRR